jgi:Type I phosphodiesterase / nucleotide pyrophosphatase
MKSGAVKLLATPILLALLPVLAQAAPHNLILFVPDGLRSQIVDSSTAPTLARLREEGVDFRNSHSLFPTFTTANASAFATGHRLGDTGDFSNTIYTGVPIKFLRGSVTPFLENNPVLREVNDDFDGNYLSEQAIVAAARASKRYSTAVIGKLGPVAIFDTGVYDGKGTLIIDDTTGPASDVPIPAEWKAAFAKYNVPLSAPSRGDNGSAGDGTKPGTWTPNLAQQQYFIEATVKAVLPHFRDVIKDNGSPFVLVFWSRDPDGTQHNHGDSFHSTSPGINGPTSLAAIRNADTALGAIEQALQALDLYDTTNIVVAADHGFSTITKSSSTSPSTKPDTAYPLTDAQAGELPPGFLAIDLVTALQASMPSIKLFDPDDHNRELNWRAGKRTSKGNGILAEDVSKPQVIVAANGGSDLIYIPTEVPATVGRKLAGKLVSALLAQDYVSGIFVDKARFGDFPGALSTESIGIGGGRAAPPHPAIVVSFTSKKIDGCKLALTLCASEIADTVLQEGQGMHGSFSRADTWNFMAARGPDFRKGFRDPLPASNADIGMTLAKLLELLAPPKSPLAGRVLTEALSATPASEPLPAAKTLTETSKPTADGLQTTIKGQILGNQTYIDAAGFRDRTLGLDTP